MQNIMKFAETKAAALTQDQKNSIYGALIGAGVGGVGMGALSLLRGRGKRRRGSALSSALLGALTGAGAGAGLGYYWRDPTGSKPEPAAKAETPQTAKAKEPHVPFMDKDTVTPIKGEFKNPGAGQDMQAWAPWVGGAYGLWSGRDLGVDQFPKFVQKRLNNLHNTRYPNPKLRAGIPASLRWRKSVFQGGRHALGATLLTHLMPNAAQRLSDLYEEHRPKD